MSRTWTLIAIAVVLLVVDFIAHRPPSASDELPTIASVHQADVTRVKLVKGDDTMVFERRGPDSWQMTAPHDYAADRAGVMGVIMPFRKGVPMDVLVEEGSTGDYGLEPPDTIRVEIDTEAGNAATFYVGNNGAGGTTFVRFADSDAVYRARIGGRHRYDRPPAAWRDHRVLDFSGDLLQSLSITTADGRLGLLREPDIGDDGTTTMGAWRLDDDATFAVDQSRADDTSKALGTLRAGQILSAEHPAGLDQPVLTADLSLTTGDSYRLTFGQTSDGTFVRRDDRTEVFQISPALLDRLAAARATWRDRALFAFDRAQVYQLSLVEPGLTTVLEQDPADSSWSIVQPANIAADLRQSMYTARTLAKLNAAAIADIAPADAGFPSRNRIDVELIGGERYSLEIGANVPDRPAGKEAVYVRTADQRDRVGILDARTLSAMRKAWSR